MIRYDYDPAGSRFGANIRLSSYLANPLSVRSLGLAPAQHHIRVGPVLRIEKRIAADRGLGIGPFKSRWPPGGGVDFFKTRPPSERGCGQLML